MFNVQYNQSLSMCILVNAQAKRVGNSLAVFLPAAKVREAGIKEGDNLTVRIELNSEEPLGLMKRMGFGFAPYSRREEGVWRDRV